MKKNALQVANNLSLPLAYATSRNMCLAQSGTGKSNACVVLAEEMHRVKIPWITIDTKGDWYGIRSNRSGKQRGLDVPVFGGEYGDMPLSPLAGSRMAELVAAGKLMGVLDVSDFPKPADVSRFLIDFANTLLKKQRTPVHLFLEECSDYLPQGGYRGQIDPLAAACVGAMKRLATKGRFRGIGYTVISQRPAEVNKTVLYQCETLIALRMVGDLDVKWIEGWVKRSSKRAPELLETLHELENGEGWIWSPGKLKIIERVKFRRRETFDSGAEPEIGKARVVPRMAPVELAALRKELADLEEQAKADDPRELKKKVATLEGELKKKQVAVAAPAPAPRGTVLGKHDVVVDDRRLTQLETKLRQVAKDMAALLSDMVKSAGPKKDLSLLKEAVESIPKPQFTVRRQNNGARAGVAFNPAIPTNGKRDPAIGDGGLYRMMIALAQKPGLTREQLAIRAGMAMSGTFGNYLSKGRTEGWIEGKSEFSLTQHGLSALGRYDPLPEGDDLFEHWLKEIGGGGVGAIMRVLKNAYPAAVEREELAKLSGMAASGTFGNYLSKLRKFGIAEGRGEVKLSEELVG